MKNRLLTLAGTLALLAVLGKFYARPVLAEVRTALVQDIDNPARHPYTVELNSARDGACDTQSCSVSSPPVPQGERLVVEQVNVSVLPSYNTTIVGYAQLYADAEPAKGSPKVSFYFPITEVSIGLGGVGGPNTFMGNFAGVAYFEPGSTVNVSTTDRYLGGHSNDDATVTISGYLVDLP